jgi:dihydrofolate reductase
LSFSSPHDTFNQVVERLTGADDMSARIVAVEWMSLDGVVQAPGAPDEDPSGGFAHGGWHLPYFDDRSRQWVVDGLERAGAFLFGRRTYDQFAGIWPHVTGPEAVVADPLNRKPKYLASRSRTAAPEWAGTTLLDGDATDAVKGLPDGDVYLIGSAGLARELLARDLIDELQLMLDPVLLGGGKQFFPTDGSRRAFSLIDCTPTSTGALLLTYRRDQGLAM